MSVFVIAGTPGVGSSDGELDLEFTRGRRNSPAALLQLWHLRDQYARLSEAARKHGVTPEAILSSSTIVPLRRARLELYLALRADGLTDTSIAKLFGRTPATIGQTMRYHSDEAWRVARKCRGGTP